MVGRNSGICHSCRSKSHFFAECPRKRQCPSCKRGFEKCFVVEKENANKGRLFVCCSDNCDFWEWVVKENTSGPSSSSSTSSVNRETNKRVDEMSRMFESRLHLTDELDLKISMNLTICKAKGMGEECNAKGKGSTFDLHSLK